MYPYKENMLPSYASTHIFFIDSLCPKYPYWFLFRWNSIDLSGRDVDPCLLPTQTTRWTPTTTYSHLGRVGIQDSTLVNAF